MDNFSRSDVIHIKPEDPEIGNEDHKEDWQSILEKVSPYCKIKK